MKGSIIRRISRSWIIRKFIATPSPAWMVFVADMFIVLLACLLTVTFSNSTTTVHGLWYTPTVKICIIMAVYGLVSWFLNNHRYIVRLSALSDVARVLKLVAIVSIILVAGGLIGYLVNGVPYFSIWNIFVIALITSSMMMAMRMGIKWIYLTLKHPDTTKRCVIVLGTSLSSIMLAGAMKEEIDGQYDPVALLSLNGTDRTNINGLPVINFKEVNIGEVFEQFHADTLVFNQSQLEVIRQKLVDDFLKYNIHLLMFKSMEEFNGEPDADSDKSRSVSAHVQNIRIEDLLGREPINTGNKRVRQVFTHQVVMVTGAAGSIGSEIVNQLANFHVGELVLIDQAETPMHELQLRMQEKHPDTKIHLFIGDIANYERMEQAFMKFRPRYVFHAAAYKHVPMMECNPSEAVATNVFGTKNIADLSVKYHVEKFVMISTDKAVNPTNIMGASKRIAEIYVQSLFFHQRKITDGPTTQFITTRFGNVLGSNGSVIPLFKRQIEEGGPVTVTHRDIIRYFMTIPEACSLVLEAGCMGAGGEIYVFDMGQPVKIYDLARKMISLAGLRPNIDIQIVETGLRPGEKLYEELLNDKELTIATHHKQIMIAKVRLYDYDNVVSQLDELEGDIHKANIHDIVAQMKAIVPEFVSNNSQWQAIDREIAEKSQHNN